MNYIILFGTGLIQKYKIKKSKIFLSSLLGSIYVITELIVSIPVFISFVSKIVLSILMITISFNPVGLNKMLKTLTLFYLVTFTTGGCVIVLSYMINAEEILTRNGVLVARHPYKYSVTAGVISFILVQYSFYNNKRKLNSSDMICDITIKMCGNITKTKAFIDTGNNLKVPYSDDPVVIIEKRVVEKICNLKDIDIIQFKGGDSKYKIMWIPYKSIGNCHGMLMAIKVDSIEIDYENEKIIVNNAIVGIYNKVINKNYSALVGLNFFDGGNNNEYNVNIKKDIFQFLKK